MNHCATSCFGHENYHGGCCRLEQRDFIIGPIRDATVVLERLRVRTNNPYLRFEEVFVDFAEGSRIFPERATWQRPENFPAMRVDTRLADLPCVFYNATLKACGVYEDRPETCRRYMCDYLVQAQKEDAEQIV